MDFAIFILTGFFEREIPQEKRPFKQSLEENIITLSNKTTVARIPAGQVFESAPMDLFIPANAPDRITVRLEISHIYYHIGQTDEIKLHGTATRREVSLKDTAYTGEILSALPGPIAHAGGGKTVTLAFILWADNTAQESLSLPLVVKSDESVDLWGFVSMNALFSEAKPALYFYPDHIETGVARENMVTETLVLKNKGLAPLRDVILRLETRTGTPAPSWIRLNTPSDIGTLDIGDTRDVSISFIPGAATAEGLHAFNLMVKSANGPDTHIGLYPTVTQSGQGNVLFKVSDIYTGTFNARNELIRGLSKAKIRLQNKKATTIDQTLTTDTVGEALFENLAPGAYKCRITAPNHQEYIGRIWIKPGITVTKDVFLEYNLVTVEWQVNEITMKAERSSVLNAQPWQRTEDRNRTQCLRLENPLFKGLLGF